MSQTKSPMHLSDGISNEEFFEIARKLEEYHAIFYALWEIGKPIFTNETETAAVGFDREKGETICFLFNQKHWEEMDEYSRMFTICHETLHVALNHGIRGKDSKSYENIAVNVAMDLVVNHLLVNKFGFEREKIHDGNELCWVDTIFPDDEEVKDDWSFERYFAKMMQMAEDKAGSKGQGCGEGKLVDDHSNMFKSAEELKEAVDHLDETLNDEEKNNLKDMIDKHFKEDEDNKDKKAGTGTGGWTFVKVGPVQKKRKWETVIKKWAKKYCGFKDQEQWTRLNRRFTLMDGSLFLPTELEIESHDDQKILVYFFLDTSGSVYNYASRFFKAAKSLPTDRFDLRLFCFDTEVQETTIESGRIYGGGGTRFDIIERHIQHVMYKESSAYPKAVFLISDGFGSYVKPEYPDRWYWFLTPYNSKSCIPKESMIFDLKNFE